MVKKLAVVKVDSRRIYIPKDISLRARNLVKNPVRMKKLQFVKIKCQCGHTNLIPVFKTFRVYETLECEKYGKVITELTNYLSTL